MSLSNTTTLRTFLFAAVLISDIGAAIAQPTETSDAAMRRGQAALKAGKIHEACQAFETSNRIEPNLDTGLSLAACYEQDGQLITAARLYEQLASEDHRPKRKQASREKAILLEAKAPRLRFAINPRPDGLTIEVDGVKVATTGDVRVDLGPHNVVAVAPGFGGHASVAIDHPGVILDVIIRMQPKVAAAPVLAATTPLPTRAAAALVSPPAAVPTPSPPTPPQRAALTPLAGEPTASGGNHRQRNGLLIGGAGVGLAVGSAVLFGLAASKFSAEHHLCANAKCGNEFDLARAKALLSNGKTMRAVGIGVGVGGLALIAVGTYLLATPGGHAEHVSFQVSHDGGGMAYVGQF